MNQTALLATTKNADTAYAEPTLYAMQPLTKFADIAGSYYFSAEGSIWHRLNVSANGVVSYDCKPFAVSSNFVPVGYDACSISKSLSVSLKPLAPPFWELTTLTGDDGYELERISTVIFAKSAKGRVTYTGDVQGKWCSGGVCTPFAGGSMRVLQETQNYESPVSWAGTWAANRQGAKSSVFTQDQVGIGKASLGVTLKGMLNKELLNIEPTRNIYGIASFMPETNPQEVLGSAPTSMTSKFYGRSEFQNFGGNIAIEQSPINSAALFEKTVLKTLTTTFLADGTSGYNLPAQFSASVGDRFVSLEVSTQVGSDSTQRQTLLTDSVDYQYDPVTGRLVFRSPIPAQDDSGNAVHVLVKIILSPLGMRGSPISWAIRVQ
jgi:hypothetical protein